MIWNKTLFTLFCVAVNIDIENRRDFGYGYYKKNQGNEL